ncbi:unnamed protein product [Lymnaea stagnalis]|uniref:ubiquitinyl hydrolase 1 n=1 Tax=Lymnaea stagnalis TaxID=6523 RepID=A0AAV2HXW4_LYMST
MPAPLLKKKELYLGESLGDLQKISEIKPIDSPVSIIVRSSNKVFQDAETFDSQGDEEKAFVLYLKYFNIIKQIKTKAEYKKQKEYFDKLLSMKNQIKAIERAEKLSESLKERYDLKKAEALAKKLSLREVKEDAASSITKENDEKENVLPKEAEIATEAEPVNKSGSIKCINLCGLLRDTVTKVVLMDVRPAEDFNKSHISFTDCISVPHDILVPGSTVNHIQSKLPRESLSMWQQRVHVDYIVLLDWKSTNETATIGTPLRTLKDALFKFDTSTIIKSEPLILEGGYDQWLLFYPTMTTNAHVIRPSDYNREQPPSPTMTLDFDYPEVSDNLPQNVTPPSSDGAQINQIPPASDNSGAATAAVPTVVPLPRVDRSLKPSISGENWSSTVDPMSNKEANVYSVSSANSVGHTHQNKSSYTIAGGISAPGNMSNDSSIQSGQSGNKDLPGNAIEKINEENQDVEVPPIKLHQQQLEDVERRLKDLEKMKKKEEKDVADLMRMKRKLKEDIDREKQAQEEQKMLLELEQEKKSYALQQAKVEEEKKHRMQKVEMMRQERKRESNINIVTQEKTRPADSKVTPNVNEILTSTEGNDNKMLTKMDNDIKGANIDPRRDLDKNAETGKAMPKKADKSKLDEEMEKKELANQNKDTLEKKKLEAQRQKEMAQKKQEETEKLKILKEREAAEKLAEIEMLKQKETAEKERIVKEREAAERERIIREREAAEIERLLKEKQAAERLLKEKEVAERLLKEKQIAERLLKEKQIAERLLKEKQAAENMLKERKALEQVKHKAIEQPSSKNVPSNNLPPGWEKRLDRATNRYFYIDHNRGATQWFPPPVISKPPEIYITTLKEEPSRGGLSRSHSSPNIKKDLEEEEKPTFDRTSKPIKNVIMPMPRQTAYSVRKRDLNPVYGDVGPALTGLRNLGNTCYMNSTIQCLNNTSPLITYFLNDNYLYDINRESSQGMQGEVVDEFAVVVKALWSQQFRSITPRDLKNTVAKYNPMFAGCQQQDSQEFLTFLLDGLHEGLNEVKKAPEIPEQNNDQLSDTEAASRAWKHHKLLHRSIIVELFQGQLKSSLMCGTCGKTSVTFQAFMFLSLPIPSQTKCSLKDCINKFLLPEMMTGSSKWKCPCCKVERDSRKQIDLWKLPPILLVGLNRFVRFYAEGMWMQKKTTYVDFPLVDLDFSEFIIGPKPRNRYSLFGISNHYGTMEGGHYTAFCRNPVNKKWYKFDDQDVYELSNSDVKSPAAFVLYYSSIDMPAPVYKPHL